MENAVIRKLNENGLEKVSKEDLQKTFTPFLEQAEKLKKRAFGIVITSVEQVKETALARQLRLELKGIRIKTEKTRKFLKEDSLKKGRAIDGVAKVITLAISPIEEHLQAQEDFIKNALAKTRAALKAKRMDLLTPYIVDAFVDFELMKLDEIPEEKFQQYLTSFKTRHEDKILEEMIAEEEKEKKEKAEQEERKRLALEAEAKRKKDLKEAEDKRKKEAKEADEKLKKQQEENDRQRIENDRLKKENEEADRLAQIELDRMTKENEAALAEKEKARLKLEALAQIKQEETDRKLAKEKEAREKVEAELKVKREAEAKRIADEKAKEAEKQKKLDEEKAIKEAAKEKARLASDKEKLEIFGEQILALVMPKVENKESKEILNEVSAILVQAVSLLKKE